MAMAIDDSEGEQALRAELEFLQNGRPGSTLFQEPMPESKAVAKIKQFTQAWPDPFTPGYQFANPWLTKKENKSKKQRGSPVRPAVRREPA